MSKNLKRKLQTTRTSLHHLPFSKPQIYSHKLKKKKKKKEKEEEEEEEEEAKTLHFLNYLFYL